MFEALVRLLSRSKKTAVPTTQPARLRPQLECLEDRLVPALAAVPANGELPMGSVTSPAQVSTTAEQPMQIHSTQTTSAPTSPSVVGSSSGLDGTTLYSTVTIQNDTANRVSFTLGWPGTSMKSYYLNPGATGEYYVNAGDQNATISFDASYAPGYQGKTYSLTSRDFLGGGFADVVPSQPTDGMEYHFSASGTNLNLYVNVPLNKSALPQDRNAADGPGNTQDFPDLFSNYQVLGPPTSRYNCIAWSLGYTNEWVNPITTPGANYLAGMDSLYAKEGYQRMSSLNYSLQPGYEKVVVYATTSLSGQHTVTHAALQTSDGAWSSKLGDNDLIRTLYPDDLDGPEYGAPVAVYIRPD